MFVNKLSMRRQMHMTHNVVYLVVTTTLLMLDKMEGICVCTYLNQHPSPRGILLDNCAIITTLHFHHEVDRPFQ